MSPHMLLERGGGGGIRVHGVGLRRFGCGFQGLGLRGFRVSVREPDSPRGRTVPCYSSLSPLMRLEVTEEEEEDSHGVRVQGMGVRGFGCMFQDLGFWVRGPG